MCGMWCAWHVDCVVYSVCGRCVACGVYGMPHVWHVVFHIWCVRLMLAMAGGVCVMWCFAASLCSRQCVWHVVCVSCAWHVVCVP